MVVVEQSANKAWLRQKGDFPPASVRTVKNKPE